MHGFFAGVHNIGHLVTELVKTLLEVARHHDFVFRDEDAWGIHG